MSRSGYVVTATKPMHRFQILLNSAQLWAPYHSSKLHPGPCTCSNVGMRPRTDAQTNR